MFVIQGSMQHPKFDDTDKEILERREALFNARSGPRVGDFVRFPDGTVDRFSHDWGETIQTTKGGSFYLGNGYMSFSGGLDPAIDKADLRPTYEMRGGSCWFFHHNYHAAHNGVDVTIPCRVYEYTGPDKRFSRR